MLVTLQFLNRPKLTVAPTAVHKEHHGNSKEKGIQTIGTQVQIPTRSVLQCFGSEVTGVSSCCTLRIHGGWEDLENREPMRKVHLKRFKSFELEVITTPEEIRFRCADGPLNTNSRVLSCRYASTLKATNRRENPQGTRKRRGRHQRRKQIEAKEDLQAFQTTASSVTTLDQKHQNVSHTRSFDQPPSRRGRAAT